MGKFSIFPFQLTVFYYLSEDKGLGRGRRNWKEKAWTEGEEALLKEFYPWGSKRVILEKLLKRSWSAIACKASSLKIRRLRPSEPLEGH